jgi:hypothetical protein
MNDKRERFTYHFFIAAALLLCAYIALYGVMGQDPLSHSNYDSYTRQAQSWWMGRADLPENVSWLEIAEFGGRYYVSFPPFPSVVQFLLYPFFGLDTPDNLVNTLFGLGAFALVYRYFMRRGQSGLAAALIALLMTLGSNLFYLSVTGWVWFSAQTQGFFFSALAVFLMDSRRKAAWALAFLSLACAVLCRPLNAVYIPLLVYLLYRNLSDGRGAARTLVRCLPYLLPLAAMGLLAGAYNHARFGSVLEFGHNYLPEFQAEKQFSIAYLPANFLEILKLPGAGDTFWPRFNGTLFFLVNPAYALTAVSLARGRFGAKKLIYTLCLVAHIALMLCHRTMGGWQFGSRYMADMLPFMLIVVGDDTAYARQRGSASAKKVLILPAALAALGAAVNVWGAVWFYTTPM